jgi:type IV secretory pathway VirB10-like protein
VLERQPGADTAGYAGLEDEVDNHWVALFKAALLSTLLGVGSELGSTTGTGTKFARTKSIACCVAAAKVNCNGEPKLSILSKWV